jgi:hypothetical protein
MDNVLNRPLFRHREARDRLNESVGVQRFNDGGDVRPEGLPSIMEILQQGSLGRTTGGFNPAVIPSNAPQQGENAAGVMAALNEKLQDPNLRANERRAVEKQRATLEFAINAGYGATDAVTDALSVLQSLGAGAIEYGIAPVVSTVSPELGEMLYDQIPVFDATAEELALMGQNIPRELQARDTPDTVAFEKAGRGTPPLMPAPQQRTGLRTPGDVQAPMNVAPAAGSAPVVPTGRSTMEADARDRGPLITNPADVAAGLNAPEPEVREKTAADFMQEFMTNAPKYEGADKNLMLAQIGFAIAAGESPNAMQNIANGLLAGSDMMLKDKAAKDEFDRQLQLSAMQYGLQETAKERERGRQGLPFVAMQDTTYKGRRVQKGQQVYIPYSEIERNGGMAPAGFGDTALVEALSTKQQGMLEAMQKAYEQGLVDDTFVDSQTKLYSDSVRNAASAQRGLEYVEQAILTVADGNVTGLKGSFNTLVSQAAAAAGLEDIAGQYNDRNEFIALMEKGFQNLIPSALSGVQSANSISNRDIELLAKAYADAAMKDGVFSLAFVTEDKLLNSLKGAVDVMQTGRQQSLADMSAVERKLAGRTLRSGTMGSPVSALTVLEPYQELIPERAGGSTPSQFGSLSFGEDGVYNIIYPES